MKWARESGQPEFPVLPALDVHQCRSSPTAKFTAEAAATACRRGRRHLSGVSERIPDQAAIAAGPLSNTESARSVGLGIESGVSGCRRIPEIKGTPLEQRRVDSLPVERGCNDPFDSSWYRKSNFRWNQRFWGVFLKPEFLDESTRWTLNYTVDVPSKSVHERRKT